MLKLAAAPLTTSSPATPVAPPSFRGVLITAARAQSNPELVTVDGLFLIPVADAESIGRPLHRAISLLAWGKAYWDSLDPFRNVVLFPDDEKVVGDAVQGFFSFQSPMYRGTGLYLHVALGEHLSPSIDSPP